jgi:tetratricopeptide (TPR) repeat protein
MRRFAPLVATIVPIAAAPATAQDGGTSSIFADGAGNRALSLGGAYAAIGGDASAPVWNAAGLGSMQRAELQASSATLYGLDITEQFASIAVPSWRWGTAAFGFRRFAVGGVERRSSRNVLLDEDLSDSQTELKVSFARPMGEGWDVGGSIKVHRQSLAGYDDFGVGLDLGVLLRPGAILGREGAWMDRLQLGFALRNLVEPTLRLDQEAVADPTALRAGLAWRQPYRVAGLGPGHVLAAFDVVHTPGFSSDAHAGIEVAPHPLLALRFGVDDGEFTAGTGVRWNLYAFDYSMENGPFDSVHRFGLTLQFGGTLDERRAEARRREDETFRARLAESFAEREAARIAELLGQTRALLAEERVDEALERVATIMALDPDHIEARALEAEALLAKAARQKATGQLADATVLYARVLALAPEHAGAKQGLERCRAEGDLRAARSARIRELFGLGLDAFTGGQLVVARDTFRDILDLAPEDAEARTMLERSRNAIRARTSDLLQQSNRFLDRGLLDEAGTLLADVRSLDPYAKGLAEASARLDRERDARAQRARGQQLAARPAPAVAAQGPALTTKKRKEIADLYERGMEAIDESRPDDALHYWELVWLADPTYLNVADFLKREYLLRGLESFSRGQLEDAVGLWEKALKVDPQDEKTLGYLQRAREQQMRTREILGSGTEGAQ